VPPSKKSICEAPFGSYLWFKQVEDRAQGEALQEIIAERKAAQAKAAERQPKPSK
jgi:hypothetical protein